MTTLEIIETASPRQGVLELVPDLEQAPRRRSPSVPLHPSSALLGKSLAPNWFDGSAALSEPARATRPRPTRLRLVGDRVAYTEHTDCALVVHPDPAARERLVHRLERLGYHVIAVSNSFRAVWALEHQSERIAAVLVSSVLEQHDGTQLMRFIARRHPGIRRLLMSDNPAGEPANDVHPDVDCVVLEDDDELVALMGGLLH